MSNQKELKLQQDCYKWFHNQHPNHRGKIWRVENERKRNKYEQMIAKSTGLVSGVADLNMLYSGKFYAIELKVGNNNQSKSQIVWQNIVESEGGHYVVIRSLDEFKNFISEVING